MSISKEGYKFCNCNCKHCPKIEIVDQEVRSLQKMFANFRAEFRKEIHDEILRTLDYRARRSMP